MFQPQYSAMRVDTATRKTVYLLTCERKNLPITYCTLFFLLGQYRVSFIRNLSHVQVGDIVIPVDVKAHVLYYNASVHETLDDKLLFYAHIQSRNIVEMCGNAIRLIPSYDDSYTGENIHGKFILKHKHGLGSEGIIYKRGYVRDLVARYRDYQIQDVLDIIEVHSVNCHVKNGKITAYVYYKSTPNRTVASYLVGVNDTIIEGIDRAMLRFCKLALRATNYQGLVEFEFAHCRDGRMYIMECNPRMSGWAVYPNYFKTLIEKQYGVPSDYAEYHTRRKTFKPGRIIATNNPVYNLFDYMRYRTYDVTYRTFQKNASV